MTERMALAAGELVDRFWALGAQKRSVNGARWTRDPEAPDVPACNFVSRLVGDDPEQIRRTLADAAEWIGGPAPTVHVGAGTAATTEAALILAGWRPTGNVVELVASSPLREPLRRPADIRPAATGSDWAHLAELFRLDHEEEDRGDGRPVRPPEHTAQAVGARRRKTPDVRYRIAWVDGTAAGFFAAWPRGDELAMVEDLFVRAEYRRTGVATQLLHNGVAEARSLGAPSVLIRADAADSPKDLYHAAGFAPVAVTRSYGPAS